jgi:hypothetical protein
MRLGNVRPAGNGWLTPGNGRLTHGCVFVAPGRGHLTVSIGRLAPVSGRLAPGNHRLAPVSGRLAPGNHRLAPVSDGLAPGSGGLTAARGRPGRQRLELADPLGQLGQCRVGRVRRRLGRGGQIDRLRAGRARAARIRAGRLRGRPVRAGRGRPAGGGVARGPGRRRGAGEFWLRRAGRPGPRFVPWSCSGSGRRHVRPGGVPGARHRGAPRCGGLAGRGRGG